MPLPHLSQSTETRWFKVLWHVLGKDVFDNGKVEGTEDAMEYSNGRTWPYHGMNAHAMRRRSSVLNTFWRDHISDKNGR